MRQTSPDSYLTNPSTIKQSFNFLYMILSIYTLLKEMDFLAMKVTSKRDASSVLVEHTRASEVNTK